MFKLEHWMFYNRIFVFHFATYVKSIIYDEHLRNRCFFLNKIQNR